MAEAEDKSTPPNPATSVTTAFPTQEQQEGSHNSGDAIVAVHKKLLAGSRSALRHATPLCTDNQSSSGDDDLMPAPAYDRYSPMVESTAWLPPLHGDHGTPMMDDSDLSQPSDSEELRAKYVSSFRPSGHQRPDACTGAIGIDQSKERPVPCNEDIFPHGAGLSKSFVAIPGATNCGLCGENLEELCFYCPSCRSYFLCDACHNIDERLKGERSFSSNIFYPSTRPPYGCALTNNPIVLLFTTYGTSHEESDS